MRDKQDDLQSEKMETQMNEQEKTVPCILATTKFVSNYVHL